MKSKSRITKRDETMQASMRFMLAGLLCFLLAPLSSEAQENDKWGPWGEWTPCSRTCGVGVSYQERECLEKEKPEDYCKGNERNRRRTCNIQDCPEGSRDFRLEQCEAYNNRTVDGQKYKWMPYIPSHERCALNCMPKGKFFYFQWADKVVDGTRCSVDSYDICVDGKCEKLGCDLILNSNAKEDKCRVCNGNGETCKTHKGVNTEDGDGYKEIVVIPASATNIDIQEIAPSSNFLALSDSSRSYFFNGDYVIENPKKLLIAGTVFNYERTRFDQERIYSLGPTSIPVHVEVLFLGEKNPGISYEFSVPKSVTKLPERAQFSWRTGDFDKCSATCAGGEQKRRVYCVRDDSGEEVSKSNCDDNEKPSHKQKCNPQPCPASWFISAWSTCSLTCGRGKMVRRVHCQHIVEGGDAEMIPDEQCPDSKPITMRICQMQKSCPEWSESEWSKCNVSCGHGFKHRNVTCQTLDTKKTLQPERCNLAFRPNDKEQCNPGPCTVTWMASNWSECYPKCGKGMSTRMVYCVSISDKTQKYPDDLCNEASRPINEKNCLSDDLCPPMWHASQWSKCTATCGVGMQMRNVMCGHRVGPKMLSILSSDRCNKEKKMNGMQKCSVKPCQAGWYIYPWEPCSKTCGQGVRRRGVKCFADSKEDPEEKWCKAEHKPVTEEECIKEECKVPTTAATTPTQTTAAVTTKQTTPSTAKPSTTTAAEVTTAAAQERTTKSTTTTATEEESITTMTTAVPTITKESTTTESAEITTVPEETETSTVTTITQKITTKVTEEEETSTATSITQETTTKVAEKVTTADQETTTEAAKQTTTESATTEADTQVTTVPDEETTTATTITQETTATAEQKTTTEAAEQTTTVPATTKADTQVTTVPEEETSTVTTITQETTTTTTTDQETTTEAAEQTTTESTTREADTEVTTVPELKETSTATTITAETKTATKEETTTVQDTTTETAEQTTTLPTQTEETATSQASSTITSETSSTTVGTTTAETSTTTPPPTTTTSATTTPPPTTTTPASTTPQIPTEPPTTARRIIPAKITDPPEDTMAYVGAEVLFRCRATGYPEPLITWRKGPIPVSSLDSSRIQILSNGDLRITDITKDNDDIYTCTATNFVGPMDSRQARLDVIVPVSVSVSPTNTTAQPGDNVKIMCASEGVPEPEVEWYKNSDLLNSQGRVRVSRTEVVISQVQASDSGYYKCRAHHNYGGASDRMFLNVIRKEEPTTPPTIEKCEDSPAIAHCSVVRQVNFCCINFYKKACCKTCEDLFPTCDL